MAVDLIEAAGNRSSMFAASDPGPGHAPPVDL